MTTASTPAHCAHCGQTIDDAAQAIQCQRCSHVDLTVFFCDQNCRSAGLEKHQKEYCAGPSNRRIDLLDEQSWNRSFCTPGCRVEISSTRLLLRPVTFADTKRVTAIKTDRIVNCTQLYGSPRSEREVRNEFVAGYVQDVVPASWNSSMFGLGRRARERYVFAIEPRVAKGGKRALEPVPFEGVKHNLDANGYIGNLAVEITPHGSFGVTSALHPRPGVPFRYTSGTPTKGSHAVLFYEIHPNFWRQGIMTEAIKAILPFCFQTLKLHKVVIDPLAINVGSVKLAESLGFKQVGIRGRQLIFERPRADWEKARKKNARKNQKKKKPVKTEEGADAGKAVEQGEAAEGDDADPPEVEVGAATEKTEDDLTCRWCQVPSTPATHGCSGCDWAFWCSQPCKTADLILAGGHSRDCPRKKA
ncbi:hypothetical protein JCM8097_002473 [Rhodosporidiobolus ruineniae]